MTELDRAPRRVWPRTASLRRLGAILALVVSVSLAMAGGSFGGWVRSQAQAATGTATAEATGTATATAAPAALTVSDLTQPLSAAQLTWLHQSLERYVHNDDPSFSWSLLGEQPFPPLGTVYRLRLTSQTWQGIVWQHRLLLFVPRVLNSATRHTALLYITGSEGESESAQLMASIASQIGAPVAVLFDVPNQPLLGALTEDALIAETFVRFLRTGDPTWAALLPMTKAAVRAMDAVQAFAARQLPQAVDSFVVTGASKRGWTTWLTGAVDPRVKGIAPMVYNNLDLPAQMRLQKEEFGDFSLQISDYTAHGLTDLAAGPAGQALAQVVDPFTFVDRLTMPKLIIGATNDPYWPVDALNVYRPALRGPIYQLFVPNAGHGLAEYDMIARSLSVFYLSVTGQLHLPTITASFQPAAGTSDDGAFSTLTVNVSPGDSVQQVQFWVAAAPSRDFRQASWIPVQTVTKPPFTSTLRRVGEMHFAILAQVVLTVGGQPVVFSTPVYTTPSPAKGVATGE